MCSVVGCDSWRRSAQSFSLPEDPERRLQWVQFVAEDDEQLLKESSWTDIVICREHFLGECFEKPVETDKVQLKPSAVPSVRIKSEVGEFVDSLLLEEPLKTEGGFGQYDTVPTPTDQTLYKEKVDPLLVQEKHLMNENGLFELFPHKCPSCDGKLQTKKLNEGTLVTLTQQCLLCEYQNEYKKQITASTTVQQSSTGSTEVEPDPTDEKHSNSETPVPCKEENDLPDEEEGGGNRGVTSDEDWFPIKKPLPIKEEDIEENAKEVPNNVDTPPSVCQRTKLPCNECGYLYHTDMAHIVEHKPDPTNDKRSVCHTLVPCKEESDVPDEDERGGDGDGSSSEDWFPIQKRRKAVTVEPDPADNKHSYSQTSDSPDEEEGGEDVTSEEDWKPVLAEQEVTQKLRNYVDLPTSVRRSTKQLCNECGYFYNTDRAHICEHKLKPYACNVCGKRCFTKTSLKLHCLIHDDSKVHACKYCYAPFKTKQAKLDHQETHEDTPYPFQCPDCPATFACFLERREHLRSHTKPKEHKCDKCGITFRRRYVLHRHMVVHTGVKPYKCSVCERSFNQPGHLKSHLRLHTGEKPYKCQHCDKSFNHNVSLKSHMQRYHHNERSNNTDDAPDSNDSESDFCNDNEEKEQNTEEGGEDRVVMAKASKLLTGRPRGRPKRNDEGKLALSGKRKGLKKGKSKLNQHHRNEESEDELTDLSFDLEQEEEKNGRRKVSRKCSSQLENTNDYDCDSKVTKKKRSWRRGLRKGRGKAKKK